MERMLIAVLVFLGATASALVGSWAGPLAGMLLAAAVAATMLLVSPLLTRTRSGRSDAEAVNGWRNVAIELARSRRHRRSLAVMRIVGAGTDPSSRAKVTELRRRLRVVDQLWAQGNDLYVLLPEANASTAGALEVRLRAELLGMIGHVRLAVFPDYGITVGSLRRRLMESGTSAPADLEHLVGRTAS